LQRNAQAQQNNQRNHFSNHKPAVELKRELTINDLVFIVGPRINAAGRIESGKDSVELLIAEDLETAYGYGRKINELNAERKNLDLSATHAALDMIRHDQHLLESKCTIVYDPSWHKGVIGIVASRLIENYYKPTIVFTRSEDLITGSARSVKGFDIYDAVDHCSDLLEHFGGHTYAAGLSLKPENLDAFRERFENYALEHVNKEMEQPEIEVDAILMLKEINNKFYRVLKQFAPFGPGNPSPVFQTNNVVDTGHARTVGKDNNHLKLSVVQLDITGYPISSIAFQQGENWEYIKDGNPFRICYNIEENEWNGRISLQLNIKDIMPEPLDT
jgi:single-stranded-DNA-specific exonuclease